MRSIRLLLGAAALAMLAACSGDGDGGGATISGGVVKGPVLGSTVCAFALTGGAKGAAVPLALGAGAAGSISGGCYVTPADGSYNFALPAGTSGDLLIEATGGSFCSNESQVAAGACTGGGTVINLGGAVMSSIVAVPAAGSNATVFTTPLTTAAVTGGGAGMTSARFNERFNTLAGRVIGAGTAVTPATPPTATNQPYLATAATALQNGGTLSSVVTALNNGTTTFTATGGVPGTVNAALAGSRDLIFRVGNIGCGSLCTYTEGMTVTVVIGTDNTLVVGGKTLSNPFVRDGNLHEIIWLDAAAGVEYALSDNSGANFNEINVADPARPGYAGFIGQLRMPEASGTAALQALAGTYTFVQQYQGNDVAWTAMTIAANGDISFTGTGPNLTAANMGTVTSFIQQAGNINIAALTDINGVGGVTYDDQISLYVTPDGALKDVVYYVGSSPRGVTVVAQGQSLPSLPQASTSVAVIPATNAIHGTAGATVMNLPITLFSGQANGSFSMMAESGAQRWNLNVSGAGGILLNTNYSCVHGTRLTRVDSTPSSGVLRNTGEGGNCNVYITHLVTSGNTILEVKGRFTAEVYSYHRKDRTVISDGAFSYVAPPVAP
ncbi:MAG: hypothetical protein V4757_20740 [Pseudomonadota bacterium]